VLDDVLHFLGDEPEVDRHKNATRPTDPEECGVETCRVVTDHRDPRALGDAEGIETRGLCAGTLCDLAVGECRPRRGGLIGLVDQCDAIAVHLLGPAQEIDD